MLSANTPINMTYLTNDAEGNVKIGEAIQQDFAALGINVTVETREWSVFLDERKQGKFDFCREGWLDTKRTRSTCWKCGQQIPVTTICSLVDNKNE